MVRIHAILPLGRYQIHRVAAYLDVDGNILPFRRIAPLLEPSKELLVNILKCLGTVLGY
jgi:hypothetical protein